MRSLLIAALALATTSAPRIARACGPDLPRVFAVTEAAARTFVLLDTPAPLRDRRPGWTLLHPGTFDDTAVAPAPALAEPMTVTLLSESGAQVVTTSKQVWFQLPFGARKSTGALELSSSKTGARPVIAIAGDASGATWLSVAQIFPRASERVALEATGPINPESMRTMSIGATELHLAVGTSTATGETMNLVLARDGEIARFTGTVVGGFELGGARYLIVRHGFAVHLEWI